MPTISVNKADLETLVGEKLTLDQVEEYLPWVKGEFKGFEAASEEVKIELADSNRPDLWCVEGIARQIKTCLKRKPIRYPFAEAGKSKAKYRILVDPALREMRPYIGAFVAKGVQISQEVLDQIIQTQEKLSEIFGWKRQLLSIGYYRFQDIFFPISYKTLPVEEIRFVPLGFEEAMSAREILRTHPKGIQYHHLLPSPDRCPVLVDAHNQILSLPPIINSREIGEVQVGDTALMVEATGTDLRMLALVMNILAANLYDRGARIEIVQIHYPYATPFGKSIQMPLSLVRDVRVRPAEVCRALGDLSVDEIKRFLRAYGYEVKGSGRLFVVRGPVYRDDVMHEMDVIEDVAICRGYDHFESALPAHFTVGGLSTIEEFSDQVRDLMVGFGFQEIISNILMSRRDLLGRMGLEARGVEVENAISQNFSMLRNWLLPSLLRVEACSSKAFYPHRLFEAGEAAVWDEDSELGSRTVLKLAVLLAYSTASFSDAHSFLEMLFYYLKRDYALKVQDHPSFIPGRAARIWIGDKEVGLVGELNPQVLTNWDIGMPCSAFEIDLDSLLKP